jgi:hypothetical protein
MIPQFTTMILPEGQGVGVEPHLQTKPVLPVGQADSINRGTLRDT